jgi:hypothetical protein
MTMANNDPPPNVDRTVLDDLDPAVRDFLAAMEKIGSGGCKLFNYKTLLYLSVDDHNVSNAVRKVFAKWLNKLSKFLELKVANLQVTNCNDEFLLVPALLQNAALQTLTGWERVKAGTSKNVYICVKMKASLPFSCLKHRMIPKFVCQQNVHAAQPLSW